MAYRDVVPILRINKLEAPGSELVAGPGLFWCFLSTEPRLHPFSFPLSDFLIRLETSLEDSDKLSACYVEAQRHGTSPLKWHSGRAGVDPGPTYF